MTIYTFGDSHALKVSGWKDCNNVEEHHLGPKLCYSFGISKLDICDISKFNVQNNDSVIFLFWRNRL